MGKFKVIITDDALPDIEVEKKILKRVNADVLPVHCRKEKDLLKVAEKADAILAKNNPPVTEQVIQSLKDCNVLARAGIGTDSIDVNSATKKGIAVVNVPSYCEKEVSNHTIALILASLRKLVPLTKEIKNGKWNRESIKPSSRLTNLTLGLVGFGTIARKVSRKTKALGFEVMAYDPYISKEKFLEAKVQKVSFEKIVKVSDVISIHTPLVEETRHMFTEEEFKKMKETAYIVNTSRGGVIDSKALYRALSAEDIAGAALDVFECEPPSSDSLCNFDNVVLTPHIALYSEESQLKARTKASRDVARVLEGTPPKRLVNEEVNIT